MEDKEFEKWYNAAKENIPIPILDDLNSSQKHKDEIWSKIREKITPERKKNTWHLIAAAMVMFGFFSSIMAMYLIKSYFSTPKYISYQTQANEKRAILLPDGSNLLLYESSKLRLDTSNWADNRKLDLEEGALFVDVKPDTLHPFVIQTDLHRVKVLGTSFQVKSYRKEINREVTVKSGRVEVRERINSSKAHVLKAGDRLVYRVANKSYSLIQGSQKIDQENPIHLRYQNQPLGTILADLASFYQIEMHCTDTSLLQERYTLSFEKLNLKESLEKLKIIGGVTIKSTDGRIEITK